jgi:hypothetical protein
MATACPSKIAGRLAALLFVQATSDAADGRDPAMPEDAMTITPTPGPVVLVAGDIADEDKQAAKTAALLMSIPNATVLALGDNAYKCGSVDDYKNHYKSTWGETSILERTRACPGNHEYKCFTRGKGYFGFFKATHEGLWAAATRDHYSFEIKDCRWHFVSLNSEIPTDAESEQVTWLKGNLQANQGKPIVVFFHRPRFSSGNHGSQPDLQELWTVLRQFKTEIIVNGHDHSYERFLQQDDQQQLDPQGITQFVVGTGGRELETGTSKEKNRAFDAPILQFGLLKLALKPSSYDWDFLSLDGTSLDSGQDHPINNGHE